MRGARSLVLLVGLLTAPLGSGAAVLLSDDFSYPNGALISTSGGAWEHHSGSTSGEIQVASGRVLLTDADSEDVSRPFASAGDVLYAALTIRFTGLPGSPGTYFCHFKDGGIGYRSKIFATTAGAAANRFRLGIANGENSPDQVFPQDLFLNTDYRLVLRYDNSLSVGTLWVDPASEGDVSVVAADPASSISVLTFALRQSGTDGGMGVLQVDDLVVATTFGDLAGSPQPPSILSQPADQLDVAGGAATFTVLASGTAPLGYQWWKDGAALSLATNSTLALSNLTAGDAGDYEVIVTNPYGTATSEVATLTLTTPETSISIVNYNVKGNDAPDWSTNAAQVRAIGRQIEYLDPDIITFQEIPYPLTYEMTNFVKAFRPGYHLADDSGTDGYIRSAILSRYPITRSQSWLDGANLNPFGYNGWFTRDLYEAEISVPGYPEPLHVFTVHLKAGQDSTSSARRAAEANAISNFFVTGFLTTNSTHPYVLTGDMNEDIDNPPSSDPQTLERLTSAPTGLELTTPVNPFTGSRNTWSIQGTLDRRYDYILPCGLLSSNIVDSQVFRTDQLPSPPAPLLASDSETASDHLPLVMVFGNPFELPLTPFEILSISLSNTTAFVSWETTPGAIYQVERWVPSGSWTPLASNIVANGTITTQPVEATTDLQLFRVLRQD